MMSMPSRTSEAGPDERQQPRDWFECVSAAVEHCQDSLRKSHLRVAEAEIDSAIELLKMAKERI